MIRHALAAATATLALAAPANALPRFAAGPGFVPGGTFADARPGRPRRGRPPRLPLHAGDRVAGGGLRGRNGTFGAVASVALTPLTASVGRLARGAPGSR